MGPRPRRAILLQNVTGGVVEDCLVQNSVNGLRIQSSRKLVVGETSLGSRAWASRSSGPPRGLRHLIEATNTVNGKPVFYYFGLKDQVLVGLDAGHITLAAAE
ncbi:MAG: hypothetical protein ABDI20_01505, partial [Candidatus Bipolaricaulaceae bacterium]